MIGALITLSNRHLVLHPKALHALISSNVEKLDMKKFGFVDPQRALMTNIKN